MTEWRDEKSKFVSDFVYAFKTRSGSPIGTFCNIPLEELDHQALLDVLWFLSQELEWRSKREGGGKFHYIVDTPINFAGKK
jgi:hypothetical protein